MTSPNCRLFLVAPGDGDSARLEACLSAAMAAGDIASLLISAGAHARNIADALTPVAQDGDVAVLIESDIALAMEVDADGVEVTGGLSLYHDARAALGKARIVGADANADRHRAMEMAEAGADYVRIDIFADGPGDQPLGQWWAELFEVPCVSRAPLSTEQIVQAVRDGVDFVRPADELWLSPDKAASIVADAMAAIGSAQV